MTERAPRPLSNGAAAKREGHELTRLAEVENIIQKRATKFSNDDPMLAEDLAQQAREAVIRQLRKQPDCPVSHLIVKLSDAIYGYRRSGSSVDGKLNPKGRRKQYQFSSLDTSLNGETTVGEKAPTLGETFSDPHSPRRFTEERALTNTLFAGVRECLSAQDNIALTLRLQGYTWPEIGRLLDQRPGRVRRIKHRIKRVVRGWVEGISLPTGSTLQPATKL